MYVLALKNPPVYSPISLDQESNKVLVNELLIVSNAGQVDAQINVRRQNSQASNAWAYSMVARNVEVLLIWNYTLFTSHSNAAITRRKKRY